MRLFLLAVSIFISSLASFALEADDFPGRNFPLNDDWKFHFAYDVRREPDFKVVTLPHTWNADEVQSGKIDYTRTMGIYERKLVVKEEWRNKRLFLYFEGANSVATVFVNQKLAGEHRGGYTAFSLEISDFLERDKENLITVWVSNAYRLDVLPLSGDFNIYGGLHRPVSLLITEQNCISPLDFASPGVYLTAKNVSEKQADVAVLTKLSLKGKSSNLQVKTTILDANENVVAQNTTSAMTNEVRQDMNIENPILWNGLKNPYLYKARVELLQAGQVIDAVIQPLGLRYYSVDANRGFILNGEYLNLYGAGRHEDVKGKGSALTRQDYERDMELIRELGATTMRLTHYPHKRNIYDLADKFGIVLWTEIPLVGPGGYTGPGFVNSEALKEHARQVLKEMIRQKYNHPSVFFWGLFNELKLDYDNPVPFVEELNALAKSEDPTRLTVCASFLDNDAFNKSSDIIAWNKYYGWYGGKPEYIGIWADDIHKKFPNKPIAVSEYGAGASPYQHTDSLFAPQPTGRFHPEEWQTYYHEKNWQELVKRPFIWGKYVWVFADFGSSIRSEGDTDGMNDKGLLSYDRQVKKDAFYFYKANWNPEPMLYISERRFVKRTRANTHVKVFTNLPEAELFVNGKSLGKKSKDELNRIVWENISLRKGRNKVVVRGKDLYDSCEWELQ